ncbi:FadR/GntR family transcriptional regulator [Virgibacillus oceani]|uniref:GntR family transcriptional regulator n=1 Tax=Virgibacillus oceani TaxID=1479511 RepID=A0A917M991_9BACI|nr:FadR/GntR family transcriptional regulator [Virgibacillus oceani]GGG85752.1 GntR family transcriptional regulator [Virgibacillus oceani]
MLQAEKVSRKKVSEIIVEQIEGWIHSGKVHPDEKLPSVRELCSMFEVGRSAVRDAITTLTGKGLVEVKHGEGTFVRSTDPNQILSGVLLFRESDINELYQVRKILEAGIVEMAAVHASVVQIDSMKQTLDQLLMATTLKGWEADYRFHQQIAEASGNQLLINLMEAVSSTMKKGIMDTHRVILSDINLSSAVMGQHVAIYDAIEANDSVRARTAMLSHLTYVEELLHHHLQNSSD